MQNTRQGELAGTTRVFVTNQLQLLQHCDFVVVVDQVPGRAWLGHSRLHELGHAGPRRGHWHI
jgi:hypothetical protein